MADKWADYLISAVRYNEKETHIVKVRSHPDNVDSVVPPSEIDRATVVGRLGDGYTYATIYTSSNNKWKLGAHVREVDIDGTKYIRTDADRIKADNLGELPRF
jgi:hypothetical protein